MALKEQFDHWKALLNSLTAEQITVSRFDDNWSIKDVIAHLWSWQQISNARMEAAVLGKEPIYPAWTLTLNEDWEEDVDRTNAWIYETQHAKPWSEIYQNWRAGYLKLLDSAQAIPEQDLLGTGRYVWLNGYSLVFILVASYDHHQEHLEKLNAALQQ